MAARLLAGAFASGAVTSVAIYSLYAYVIQAEPGVKVIREEPASVKLLNSTKDIFKYGMPDRGPDVRIYSNHALCYDRSKKIPLWVAEHIIPSDIKGDAHRKHANFVMDPSIPPLFGSQNSDYKRSGWSRGHMAPAADHKHSQAAMDESFYLSNVVPQDIDNNRDFWNRLESYCRGLVAKYSDVWVTTGPLILPTVEKDGKKYVKYQVIGKNNVAVPTHLYKLITVALPEENHTSDDSTDAEQTIAVGAFIVPNCAIPSAHQDLKDYQVPLENLSESAGVQFLSKLGSGIKVRDLCEVDSCSLMSPKKMQLYVIGRRVENATTMHRLEESWKELEKRNLEPDDYLQEAYRRKKRELQEKEKQKVSF